jgi:hypothetical protein
VKLRRSTEVPSAPFNAVSFSAGLKSLLYSLGKRDSLRGASEASALAARFRTGVAAAAAEKDSEVLLASTSSLQQPATSAAAGDALARPSPVRFTVEPQSASIKPHPERPQAAAAGGKLGLDTAAAAAPVIPPEDLVEFNREDSEVVPYTTNNCHLFYKPLPYLRFSTC